MSPGEPGLPAEERGHLERCIELAEQGLAAGDEPFGSVLVGANGSRLAEGRNRVVATGDQTQHPGIELARWAAQHLSPTERAARSTASCWSSTTGRSPPGADQSDRVRVGGVGLAALAGGEHAHLRQQRRRHVHYLLSVSEQLSLRRNGSLAMLDLRLTNRGTGGMPLTSSFVAVRSTST